MHGGDEEATRKRAAEHGLIGEEVDQRLRIWIVQNSFLRERELGELAEDLLQAGLWGDSKRLVTTRACAAAERVYSHYGMSSADAAQAVQRIFSTSTAGWVDERQAALRCQQLFAKKLPAAGQIPEPALVEELIAGLIEEPGYPADVARRLVDLEVERRLLGLAH